jgi:hypothetical protein
MGIFTRFTNFSGKILPRAPFGAGKRNGIAAPSCKTLPVAPGLTVEFYEKMMGLLHFGETGISVPFRSTNYLGDQNYANQAFGCRRRYRSCRNWRCAGKDWSKVRIGTEGAYPPFNSLTPTASWSASTSISPMRFAKR